MSLGPGKCLCAFPLGYLTTPNAKAYTTNRNTNGKPRPVSVSRDNDRWFKDQEAMARHDFHVENDLKCEENKAKIFSPCFAILLAVN